MSSLRTAPFVLALQHLVPRLGHGPLAKTKRQPCPDERAASLLPCHVALGGVLHLQ